MRLPVFPRLIPRELRLIPHAATAVAQAALTPRSTGGMPISWRRVQLIDTAAWRRIGAAVGVVGTIPTMHGQGLQVPVQIVERIGGVGQRAIIIAIVERRPGEVGLHLDPRIGTGEPRTEPVLEARISAVIQPPVHSLTLTEGERSVRRAHAKYAPVISH